MEEGLPVGGRRGGNRGRATRPESSASTHSYNINRMTPTSSNSSAAHLPARREGRTPSAGASLLQERLRDRKVESARQSRRRSVDMDAERGIQSSPIRQSSVREERRPSSSSNGAKGMGMGMGVKQIEEVRYHGSRDG